MTSTVRRWLEYLVAILIGNFLYFTASRYLPPAARDAATHVGLGTLVDLWFCLFAYGLIELGRFLGTRLKRKSGDE